MQAVLNKCGQRKLDTLVLAIPVNVIHLLDLDSVAGRPGQLEAIQGLLQVYRAVEQLIREDKVGEAGLCDLHPAVFKSIYEQAVIKPTSVQVSAVFSGVRSDETLSPGQPRCVLGAGGAESSCHD